MPGKFHEGGESRPHVPPEWVKREAEEQRRQGVPEDDIGLFVEGAMHNFETPLPRDPALSDSGEIPFTSLTHVPEDPHAIDNEAFARTVAEQRARGVSGDGDLGDDREVRRNAFGDERPDVDREEEES